MEEHLYTSSWWHSWNVNHQTFLYYLRITTVDRFIYFPPNCFNLQVEILISNLSVKTGKQHFFRKAVNSGEMWVQNAISFKIHQYFMNWKWQSDNIFNLLRLLNAFSLAAPLIIYSVASVDRKTIIIPRMTVLCFHGGDASKIKTTMMTAALLAKLCNISYLI